MKIDGKRSITALILALSLTASLESHTCLLNESNPFVGVNWIGIAGTQQDVLQFCPGWTKIQNHTARHNLTQSSPDYKSHQWCTGETEIRTNAFGQQVWHAKILKLSKVNLEQLALALIDQVLFPESNTGNPDCLPDCGTGEGVNSITGNAYYDSIIHMNNDLKLLLSYNSSNGEWNSSITAPYMKVVPESDGAPETRIIVDETGREHPVLNYNEGWYCSRSGVRGYESPYGAEFEAEMAHRILKFAGDGRINEILNRDTGRKYTYSYDDTSGTVTIRDENALKSYTATLNQAGKPTSISINAAGETSTITLNWDDMTGNLTSQTGFGKSVSYQYEDERFPTAITGLVNQDGDRYLAYEYDNARRVVKSYAVSESGETAKVISIDYSFIEEPQPYVRVTDEAGLVTDRYYADFSGVKKITKVVAYLQGLAYVKSEYSYNTQGFMTRKVDASGKVTIYERDLMGREISRTEAAESEHSQTIDTQLDKVCEKPKTVTKPGISRTTYTYDSQCRVSNKLVEPLTSVI